MQLRNHFLGLLLSARAALTVLLLLSCSAGCGSDSSGQPFVRCGNGVVDGGEQCDPAFRCVRGNVGAWCASDEDCGGESESCPFNDNGECLSTCVWAACGDGLLHAGVEQCDGRSFGGASCATLGFDVGRLSCTASCSFDASECGSPLTPTAVAPPTSTATATATATPTALPSCGNGAVDPGETCDDGNTLDRDACPRDCNIAACDAGDERVNVLVSYSTPGGREPSSLSVLLTYPDGVVSIPGSRSDVSVRERVTGTPAGAIAARNDLDYQLRLVLSLAPSIPAGPLFAVQFDLCRASDSPVSSSFGCEIERASDRNGPITSGVECEVSVAP
ncbi:MAG TPA: DUF4215 domain-containing protein [Terriglobales bacterium]|nr:DUF4215 domain-containing protein [Terriglobales bacterium]